MIRPSLEEVIQHFGLQPLPEEGGYYLETYRSQEQFSHLPTRYVGSRSASTAIYYLLTDDAVSKLHRLKSDEVWHFYHGDAVELLQLHSDGSVEVVTLGNDLLRGQRCQVVVPHGTWQGAKLISGGSWALMGCTVAPGFEFADFELGKRDKLLRDYPRWMIWIKALS
jgi:uncharacterized protein